MQVSKSQSPTILHSLLHVLKLTVIQSSRYHFLFPNSISDLLYFRPTQVGSKKKPELYTTHPTLSLFLTGPSLDLCRSTLRTLLRYLTATSSSRSGFCLFGLLLALSLSFLGLSVLDCLLASGLTGLGTHGTLLLNHIEGDTDDGALGLDCAASTLLGNFLRDTLLVHAPEKDGPGDPAGVLALEKQ